MDWAPSDTLWVIVVLLVGQIYVVHTGVKSILSRLEQQNRLLERYDERSDEFLKALKKIQLHDLAYLRRREHEALEEEKQRMWDEVRDGHWR